jgi:putative peptidoglycan lipid II flippase
VRAAAFVRHVVGRFLPQGGLLLSALLFGGYVLGLVRDRIFARTFGAGPELDAYNAAFVLPELTLDVVVASGLAAPFIPIFVKLRRDSSGAEEFGQAILTGAVAVMTGAAILLFVFAPQTTAWIAPGFDAAQQARYVSLFRIMLATPILFAASLTLGEVLLAERRFLAYGSAPLLYNAGIILGTLVLSGRIGIYGAAVGAALGALLHLGVRAWGLRRSTFRIRPRVRFDAGPVRQFLGLMLPKMASHPIEPMTFLIFTAMASSLGPGNVTAISFARNFQSVPVTLVGVAFSLAAFPTLSTAFAAGDRGGFMRSLTTNLLSITILTTVAALGLFVLSTLVIEVLLGGGAFDASDVALTSLALSAFALSIPLESLTHLLSRAIFATRHTVLQVLASIAGFAVTVAAATLLLPRLGITAIPFGFAAGSGTRVVLLGVALALRLRGFRPTAGSVVEADLSGG